MLKSAEYQAYQNAKQRCTNPGYIGWKNYGGRGIKFLFETFEQFFAELGRRTTPLHSLDRFPNNNGHYEPGNVRWATQRQQKLNRRRPLRISLGGRGSEAVELYKRGLSLRQVGQKLEVDGRTILGYFVKVGVKRRSHRDAALSHFRQKTRNRKLAA